MKIAQMSIFLQVIIFAFTLNSCQTKNNLPRIFLRDVSIELLSYTDEYRRYVVVDIKNQKEKAIYFDTSSDSSLIEASGIKFYEGKQFLGQSISEGFLRNLQPVSPNSSHQFNLNAAPIRAEPTADIFEFTFCYYLKPDIKGEKECQKIRNKIDEISFDRLESNTE